MKKIVALCICLFLFLTAFAGCDFLEYSTDESLPNVNGSESVDITKDITENMIEDTTEDTIEDTTEDIAEEESGEVPPENTSLGYAEVIDMFRTAVNYYPTHRYQDTDLEDSEGIDTVPDEVKDIYMRLFVSGYLLYFRDYGTVYMPDGRNCFGYAIYDINGNGNDELILLNERYAIVAIFTLKDGKAELLFDNYSNPWLRLDGEGKIYTTKSDNGDTYSWIYVLNDGDMPELVKAYHCVNAIYSTTDECYDITGEERVRVPRSEWEDVAHGRITYYGAGEITRGSTNVKFVRLFEELHLYTPLGYGFIWSSSSFNKNVNCLSIYNVSPEAATINLLNVHTADQYSLTYEHIFIVSATVEGSVAYFQTEDVSGRVEFGLDVIWLIVERSSINGVPCGAFIYTDYLFGGK